MHVDVLQVDISGQDTFSDEVIPYLDVLGLSVKNCLCARQCDCRLLFAAPGYGFVAKGEDES